MERFDSEIDVDRVREELSRGSRVLLVVRHAERPRIDNEDKTFGAHLPLTPAGERMSEEFGRMLKGASDDVQFMASPLRRTVLTARFIARGMGIEPNVGAIYSSDIFYDESGSAKVMKKLGVLATEMEAAGLYLNAARLGKNALAICTISDHLFTGESLSAEERQTTFTQMMEIALEIA